MDLDCGPNEDVLPKSGARYRQLFENMPQAFALHEMICDEQGHPVDYRFLEVNPSFVKLTGIAAATVIGRTVREVLPDTETCWIETFGRVARTGVPVNFQNYSREFDRHYDTWVFSPAPGQFAVLFSETTESKRSVDDLQREIELRKCAEANLVQQQQKIQAMAFDLSLAEERERGRIAAELHDQVGQRLILCTMKLNALVSRSDSAELNLQIKEIEKLVDRSLQDIRSLTFQLRPPILATAGLAAAIRWLGEDLKQVLGLGVDVEDDQRPKPLAYEMRAVIFRAVRELLLNVSKHARIKRALVSLWEEGGSVSVCVADDGIGFDVSSERSQKAQAGGFGLFSVQQRIEHLGGQLVVDSLPGRGTRVTITVPLIKR